MTKGKIILIEGSDKSGKEKQTKMLVERLNKETLLGAKRMSFPRYDTPTGRIIGQCYLGKENKEWGWKGEGNWFSEADSVNPKVASLYYAADQKEAEKDMRKIINSGKHLVLDRYVESNMGHQGGKERDPKKREKFIQFIDDLSYGLLGLPRPDLTIFLYRPYEHILYSVKKGMEYDGHESNPEHLMRAEDTYKYLVEKYGWKNIVCNELGNWKSPEKIHEEVYSHVSGILKQ